MYDFTREDIDLEAIRQRIAKMSDEQLVRTGRAAAAMIERGNTRETWRIQMEEARKEWKRRHPKGPFR